MSESTRFASQSQSENGRHPADSGQQAAFPARRAGIKLKPFQWWAPNWEEAYCVGLWMLENGFWPTVIEAGKKGPDFYPAWGARRLTRKRFDDLFMPRPNSGVGLCLGPARGPGSTWLIDLEGDGPEAEESRLKLFGGEIVETLGWKSRRGMHGLLALPDVDSGMQLAALLLAAGATIAKGAGKGKGVYKFAEFPGLEFRFGGYKSVGVVKQFQSVAPPMAGREWNGCWTIAYWPESGTATLEELAERRAIAEADRQSSTRTTPTRPKARGESPLESYVRAAIEKTEARVAALPRGSCHDGLRDESMVLMGIAKALGEPYVSEAVAALTRANAANGHEKRDPGDGEELIRSARELATPADLSHVGSNGHNENGAADYPAAAWNLDTSPNGHTNGTPPAIVPTRAATGYLLDRNRKPYSCLSNTVAWLADQNRSVRYDDFRRVLLVGGKPVNDEIIIGLALEIEMQVRNAWSQDHVRAALVHLGAMHRFSSLTEWLDGLAWDGVDRVEHFFENHYGCEEREYNREVARILFLSAVARAYEPGCKVDTVPVLIGKQGCGKSSGIAALCPHHDWFTDDIGNDLFAGKAGEGLQGKWLVELAELARVNRSSIEVVKSFITRQVDRYRPPYGRTAQDYPRTCIFVATTNNDEPLQDVENRRYLPVRVKAEDVDVSKIADARDQLWAEAVHRYREGEKWWTLCPNLIKKAKEEVGTARSVDAWEDILATRLRESTRTTVVEAAGKLGITEDKLGRSEQMRISQALKMLGFTRTRNPNPPREWRYERSDVPT